MQFVTRPIEKWPRPETKRRTNGVYSATFTKTLDVGVYSAAFKKNIRCVSGRWSSPNFSVAPEALK